MNGENAVRKSGKMEISGIVTAILQTTFVTGERYSLSYIARVVHGINPQVSRHPSHLQVEFAGAFKDKSLRMLESVARYLVQEGFLFVTNPEFRIVKVTDKGRNFLDHPETMEVSHKKLFGNFSESRLEARLRQLRRDIASRGGMKEYEVMTDFALLNLVREQPREHEAIVQVPGVHPDRIQPFIPEFLFLINEHAEWMEALRLKREAKDVLSPTYRQTRELFMAGKTLEEIAGEKGVKPATIAGYLMSLHRQGMIDLKPWIKKHVHAAAFRKATQYFKHVANPRLKEAYEALGLDYSTLRLCRLYLADVTTVSETIAA